MARRGCDISAMRVWASELPAPGMGRVAVRYGTTALLLVWASLGLVCEVLHCTVLTGTSTPYSVQYSSFHHPSTLPPPKTKSMLLCCITFHASNPTPSALRTPSIIDPTDHLHLDKILMAYLGWHTVSELLIANLVPPPIRRLMLQ
jgi:hypothetical protein